MAGTEMEFEDETFDKFAQSSGFPHKTQLTTCNEMEEHNN